MRSSNAGFVSVVLGAAVLDAAVLGATVLGALSQIHRYQRLSHVLV